MRKGGIPAEHSGVCRRAAELPGSSVKVSMVDRGLMRDDVKAKRQRLYSDPLLSRLPMKRMKHRTRRSEWVDLVVLMNE